MRNITKIDIKKSIALKRLVFAEEWIDKIDRILIYVVFGAAVALSAFMILDADFSDNNKMVMSLTVLPLTLLLSLYIIYRTATEKFLIEIVTPFDSLKNKQLLLSIADKQKLSIDRNSKDSIILYKNTKHMVFLFKDNAVLFAILRDGYRINLPTLTFHLYLRRRLEKEFSNQES